MFYCFFPHTLRRYTCGWAPPTISLLLESGIFGLSSSYISTQSDWMIVYCTLVCSYLFRQSVQVTGHQEKISQSLVGDVSAEPSETDWWGCVASACVCVCVCRRLSLEQQALENRPNFWLRFQYQNKIAVSHTWLNKEIRTECRKG